MTAVLDAEAGDQRADKTADRIGQAVIAETLRAVLRCAEQADEVLQRDVVDRQ